MKTNPRLGALYVEVVENQIRDNDPPETRLTVERLKREGFTESDSKRLVATVIAAETFWIMKKQDEFNLKRFVYNLNRLPASPEEQYDAGS
jgi:hypothetical protein